MIDSFVSLVSSRLPDKGEAARELLTFQLGEVVLGAWFATSTATDVGLMMGLAAKLRHWLLDLRSAGLVTSSLSVLEIHPPQAKASRSVAPKAAGYLVAAALEHSVAGDRQETYGRKVNQIRSSMALSGADLARLLGVSREAVRQWENGSTISEDRWATIDSAYETVQRLLKYFKPDRLPAVIRRPIPGLGNRSPWDLLLMRREDELLRFYERVFSYGVTD